LKECEKSAVTGRYPEEGLVGDYKIEEKGKRILLTEEGIAHIEKLLLDRQIIEGSLQSPRNLEYVHHVTQSLRATYLYHLDRDYVVRDKKVEIVDEFTGRVLEGRRYSEGLHQAIEVKEKLPVARANRTLASITFQNFFRMYNKLSGMTGTADTEAKEFHKIYGLGVVVIPTNRSVQRQDDDDVIFVTEERKFEAIAEEVKTIHQKGQPVLVGTVSIEKSEKLSRLFTQRGIRHEVLNAKNHHREALIISEAGSKGAVTIATNMAGRGTDIKLGGSLEHRARLRVGTGASAGELLDAQETERPQWLKDYEGVRDLGGLYVIGSERHESRRIDNQLRGRSGRQGDPGKSQFYVSLEDDLMRLFGGDKLRGMVKRFGMKEDEMFSGGIFSRTLENAQRRVEDRNFEMRKHLLEYDDVVSQQRRLIYSQRDEILRDNSLIKRVEGLIDSFVEEMISPFAKSRDLTGDQTIELKNAFVTVFPFYPNLEEVMNSFHSFSDISLNLKSQAKLNLTEKETLLGVDNFNLFIRSEYLRAVDILWQSHLEALEALREAVYLRAYAQKNPLTEYKNEGFTLFNQLIEKIRRTVLGRILQVQIRLKSDAEEAERSNQRAPQGAKPTHINFNAFGSLSKKPLVNKPPMLPASSAPVQGVPKVGRNDPCPCGSGKKYKACHGQNK
jgi:preprotein translocase subunit SecA